MAQATKEKPLTQQQIDKEMITRLVERHYSPEQATMIVNFARTQLRGVDVTLPPGLNPTDLDKVRNGIKALPGMGASDQKEYLRSPAAWFKGPEVTVENPPAQVKPLSPAMLAATPKKNLSVEAAETPADVKKKEIAALGQKINYDVELKSGVYRVVTKERLPTGITTFQTSQQTKLSTQITQDPKTSPIVSVTTPSGEVVKPGQPEYREFVSQYMRRFRDMVAEEQSGKDVTPIPITYVRPRSS